MERKQLCQHTIKLIYRTIKKKVQLRTQEDIEREGMAIIAAIDEQDPTNVALPVLFELSIKVYNLVKAYPEFSPSSRLDELVEFTFQRYRLILKVRLLTQPAFAHPRVLLVFQSSAGESESGEPIGDLHAEEAETQGESAIRSPGTGTSLSLHRNDRPPRTSRRVPANVRASSQRLCLKISSDSLLSLPMTPAQ